MSFLLKLASSTAELEQLFRLRHRVFIDEKHYMLPRHDQRHADAFDALPSTSNLIALVDGRVIGGVRLVEDSEAGFPVDEYFDFRSVLPPGARACSGSMLVIAPEHRGQRRLLLALFGMLFHHARTRGMTHMTGVAAPEAEALFLRFGFRPASPRFRHAALRDTALPVMLDLSCLSEREHRFVERHSAQFPLSSAVRQFHQQGDVVFQAGSPADAAFVVIDGRVQVTAGDSSFPGHEPVVLSELGAGQILGVASLLSGQPRCARVTALTDVDLLVVPRQAFLEQAQRRKVRSHMFALLGERVLRTTTMLAQRRAAPMTQRSEEPTRHAPAARVASIRARDALSTEVPHASFLSV